MRHGLGDVSGNGITVSILAARHKQRVRRKCLRSIEWNDRLLQEFIGFIEDPSAREAFHEVVCHAEGLIGFRCEPRMHGVLRTFRYRDATKNRQPFGLIVNRKSLLFYVRKPGIPTLVDGVTGLLKLFPHAAENGSGEFTVRLNSAANAKVLLGYLFDCTIRHYPTKPNGRSVSTQQGIMTTITVPAAIVRQGDLTLYATSIKVRDLIVPGFYSVETLDPDNANDSGYQRLLNTARAKRLADYIVEGQDGKDAFLPTSVFLATDKFIPYDDERHSITINVGEVGPFGVVDGQHRLEGLRIAAARDERVLEFDVAVNIAIALPKIHQMCHFLIVNTTQKSVEAGVEQRIIARLTDAIDVEEMPTLPKWIRKRVELGDVAQAVRLVDYLNQMEDSPWKGKVIMANATREGATINQKSFVKAIVKYVLTANNPLNAFRDFDKQKRIFLNYWKAVATVLDDGNSAVLYKYNGVELFCKFSIPFFMKLQVNGNFTVSAQTDLLKNCLNNVEGDYAGVGHPEWWASGSKGSFLNSGAINQVAGAMGTALNTTSMSSKIEI